MPQTPAQQQADRPARIAAVDVALAADLTLGKTRRLDGRGGDITSGPTTASSAPSAPMPSPAAPASESSPARPKRIDAMSVALATEAWAYAIERGDFEAARGHARDLRALNVSVVWTGPKGRRESS